MYVLINVESGLYVAKPGGNKSYTNRLENAQVFKSKEEAERNKCGNEIIKLFFFF